MRSSEFLMGDGERFEQSDFTDRDEELLQAALNAPDGDLRAFEQLVELYRKRILADCFYLTRDEANSEDLAQEVFVKAYFALRSFEGRSSFRHWLQRIKVHHCLNHMKKYQGRGELTLDDAVSQEWEQLRVAPEADRRLELIDDRARIDIALRSMPATLRIPLVMCDMDDLSYEEIAKSLGLGLSAVKMRIKRARDYFRRVYVRPEQSAGEGAA